MKELASEHFGDFFHAVSGKPPFAWQTMLLQRVLERGWPEGIDLPTASGKTSALIVAVFALACTHHRPLAERLPRRVFFVVDRRIVVDAAYDEARKLAKELRTSEQPVVRAVADRLQAMAAGGVPLVVSRLRGGTLRDLTWRLNPAQPAIITGTVDQVGSRLLFRGYGTTGTALPIDAALTACDSLILLDEAHCSVPFLQTARAIQRFSGENWAPVPVVKPLRATVLSATLPPHGGELFPRPEERAAALRDAEIQRRMRGHKRARLLRVTAAPAGVGERLGQRVTRDALALTAADEATRLVGEQKMRVAVMVNRVATAHQVAEQLRATLKHRARVVLLTGRMRPVDREELTREYLPNLRASNPEELGIPIVMVATQTLEVGADFSFDALVTECASLDALRQRFGRLDRLGALYREGEAVPAAVLVRAEQLAARAEPDPIYETALKETWKWLDERAEDGVFDFGIAAVDGLLPANPDERAAHLAPLRAPTAIAPVMLPAHLDRWVQTSFPVFPDPDPELFLHGAGRNSNPEVRIVWRAELNSAPTDSWTEIVSLLPPVSAEALSVPLRDALRWLHGESPDSGDLNDTETLNLDDGARPEVKGRGRWLRWKGEDSEVCGSPMANDMIVVPADEKAAGRLGHFFQRIDRAPQTATMEPQDNIRQPREPGPLDVAEQAYRTARWQRVVRLHPAVLEQWNARDTTGPVRAAALEEPGTDREVRDHLLAAIPSAPLTPGQEAFVRELEAVLNADGRPPEVVWYPQDEDGVAPGCILMGERGADPPQGEEEPLPPVPLQAMDEVHADASDLASTNGGRPGESDPSFTVGDSASPLDRHLELVARIAADFAKASVAARWSELVVGAARLHDLGKADIRFQALLHGNEAAAAAAAESGDLLAKGRVSLSPQVRNRLRSAVGLPEHFRHELLSADLAEQTGILPLEDADRDLILHLIASHHGYARPFGPVAPDAEPPAVHVPSANSRPAVAIDAEARAGAVPAYSVASEVNARFWRLVRRHGWWGLAYLETVLRLADWRASAAGGKEKPK